MGVSQYHHSAAQRTRFHSRLRFSYRAQERTFLEVVISNVRAMLTVEEILRARYSMPRYLYVCTCWLHCSVVYCGTARGADPESLTPRTDHYRALTYEAYKSLKHQIARLFMSKVLWQFDVVKAPVESLDVEGMWRGLIPFWISDKATIHATFSFGEADTKLRYHRFGRIQRTEKGYSGSICLQYFQVTSSCIWPNRVMLCASGAT